MLSIAFKEFPNSNPVIKDELLRLIHVGNEFKPHFFPLAGVSDYLYIISFSSEVGFKLKTS